jgi:hypothetical protein
VGGVAVVTIAIAMIFYLRQRSRAPSARSADLDAFQPHMDGIARPLSDGGTVAPSSSSGSPVTMRFYVRILPILAPRVALVSSLACTTAPISAPPEPG